jgi:hypothetical protein
VPDTRAHLADQEDVVGGTQVQHGRRRRGGEPHLAMPDSLHLADRGDLGRHQVLDASNRARHKARPLHD